MALLLFVLVAGHHDRPVHWHAGSAGHPSGPKAGALPPACGQFCPWLPSLYKPGQHSHHTEHNANVPYPWFD